MDELSLWSWLAFVGDFLGYMLHEAFALAGEEENLEGFLDNLSRAMDLGEECD